MNIDPMETGKRYWWIVVLVGYLGLGQYFEGLQPMFRFQLEAHAQEEHHELEKHVEDAARKMAQTNKKLDEIACLQIVANYINAKKTGDATMIAHWTQQASIFNCTLPT